ncbi:unnamed protein product [Adineta ricciae]|uniref:Dynein regulatory complex subunit 7 n=1 Tax=Adineta ricciae TaxID=249248 RepID=A0A815Q818_ADIRI|nr:unnamed protein product [Adineta ricciae]
MSKIADESEELLVASFQKDESDEFVAESIDDQHEAASSAKLLTADGLYPVSPITCLNIEQHAESYRSNSKREDLILTYVENFRRQYHHIYPHRSALLLNPLNECGVPKFVCTTIRSTMLPYSDLTEWHLAAEFLADHLNYDFLNPSYQLPPILSSPTKILVEQHGNCFDYANLLCSLLIGAGYDAYIVSGYATREICCMDTTRLPNPYSRRRETEDVEPVKCQCKKYAVKPLKDLTSTYDAYMRQRHLDVIKIEKNRIENEENRRKAEIERPIDDPLYGVRIHAWTLILPGKCDITDAFYIEPTTGYAKSTDDSEYLGVESVWNNQNYWINMQDCSDGCKSLQFDLNDQARWECMFPRSTSNTDSFTNNIHADDNDENSSQQRSILTLSNQMDWFDKIKFYSTNPLHLPVSNINAISYYEHYPDRIKSEIYKQFYTSTIPNIATRDTIPNEIDLPLSWVDPLDITSKNFQKRYPNARKTCYFKKTCVQKYAPYSMKDGIVLKVLEFDDYDFSDLIYIICRYEHRYDKLEMREYDVKTNRVYEKYRPGRNDHWKEYIYNFESSFDRTMIFYNKSRPDNLFKRHETPNELTEYFVDHEHCLASRKIIFETQSNQVSPAHKVTRRSILSITERFNRNPSLNSNDDIQELLYAVKDNKFILTYHRDANCITPSVRTFIKPANWNDKTFAFKWNDDLHKIYQADADLPPTSQRDVFAQLLQLIKREENVIKQVRKSEDEIRELQSCRQQEELASDLEVSIYDIDRNEKSKLYNELLEEGVEQNKDDEIDYLAPYLAAIGNPKRITAQIAEQIRHKVTLDFEHQLVRRANVIQSHYEAELTYLAAKNPTSIEHQQGKFRLAILEQRLKDHEQSSQRNYSELENKLDKDARLKEPYVVR